MNEVNMSGGLRLPPKKASFDFRNLRKVLAVVGIFILLVIAFLALRVFIFNSKSGAILFETSVSEEDQALLANALADLHLTDDLTISASSEASRRSATEYAVLYNIFVPVTDRDNEKYSLTSAEFATLTPDLSKDYYLTPLGRLDTTVRLLPVDGNYFLDTFDKGALFYYLDFSSENREEAAAAARSIAAKLPALPEKSSVLSFAQTGVTAPSRGMYTKLKETGNKASYFAEKIAPYLSQFDLTHTSNESSFSAQANSENICADIEMANLLLSIGLDIVELTGNHNLDCGDEDVIATVNKYTELGIKTVGGGVSATQAAQPLRLSEKDTNITLLAYNFSTGGYTLDETPGANFYTEEKAAADIAAAKSRGDFIIVDVQYYECNEYVYTEENTTCDAANSSAGDQIGFFRHLIDLGANIVVGTSAHQPQTFEYYNYGTIYYGLGNLFFDQSWWPGTTRSLVLAHYFYQGQLLQTRLVPTIYDGNYQTARLDDTSASAFIARLIQARPNV